MALPRDYTIQCVAGDTFKLIVSYLNENDNTPVDLTAATLTMKVYSKSYLQFTLGVGTGLTVNGPLGQITIDLTTVQTGSLVGLPDRMYVLRVDSSDTVIMYGPIEVYKIV